MSFKPHSKNSTSILIVDDEQDLREIVSEILEGEADRIRTASDGQEALDILNNETFSVIVSDIKMPRLTGLDLLKTINERKILTPVIFLTGFADKEMAIQALKLGAFDFLEKPFKNEALRLSVRTAFKSNQQIREFYETLRNPIPEAARLVSKKFGQD